MIFDFLDSVDFWHTHFIIAIQNMFLEFGIVHLGRVFSKKGQIRALKQSYDIKCRHMNRSYLMLMSSKHGTRPSEEEDPGNIIPMGDISEYLSPRRALLLVK